MLVNLMQCRGTVGSFNSRNFVFNLKHKDQHLLIHSHSNAFSYYASFFRNSVVLFLFFAVFLMLKLNNCKKNPNNSRALPFLVAVIKARLAAWFHSLFLRLSRDVELNPGPKRNSRNAFLIFVGI